MLTPVIMAGGSGSRLWPLSRSLYPKQFLPLTSDYSMLQETVLRLDGIESEKPLLICNDDHRFLAAEQMRQIDQLDSIILEPCGRNTAPAIALAALQLQKRGKDKELMLVLAADHVFKDVAAFQKAVLEATTPAQEGQLVTFGIVPKSPETGYGYIKRGEEHENGFAVEKFVEKPQLETAEAYLATGEYYWNSGMFLFRVDSYLKELQKFSPEILEACQKALNQSKDDMNFIRLDQESFQACPSDSIDFAVMEKTSMATVIPLDAGWNDVGSWSSLWEVNDKDEQGNAIKGDVITHDSQDCYIFSRDKLVTTIGLTDTVVVETKDAVLVANKDSVQDVKTIVDKIKQAKRSEHKIHREAYRPWGKYDSIDRGDSYQVKHITVSPGEKLSLQMHHHRAEHWIIVSGTAKVTKGEETLLLSENQSTFIPLGTVHALENPGVIPLEMIEVQSGSYLGEDDIIRFEDRYGR